MPAAPVPPRSGAGRTIARLRALGAAEGVSYLVLLGVAMPLKYVAGRPEAVKVVGWVHGLLFVAYVLAILDARRRLGWPSERALRLLVAALLPFGPFVADRGLRAEQRAHEGTGDSAPDARRATAPPPPAP